MKRSSETRPYSFDKAKFVTHRRSKTWHNRKVTMARIESKVAGQKCSKVTVCCFELRFLKKVDGELRIFSSLEPCTQHSATRT